MQRVLRISRNPRPRPERFSRTGQCGQGFGDLPVNAGPVMEFEKVIKMGRTEMQDAVPVTLGQEFAGFADTISEAVTQLTEARAAFMKVNLGGTAIGTGLSSPPGYSTLAIRKLAELTGFPFVPARDLVGASSDGAGFIQMSGAIKRAGITISKICNDLRLMRFCSSRTLPGQSYSRSHIRASSEKLRCGRL